MKTEPIYAMGDCPNSRIRIKAWKGGFSIKCMTAKIVHTMVETPFELERFQDAKCHFCENCSSLNKTKPTTKLNSQDWDKDDYPAPKELSLNKSNYSSKEPKP